ncbi:hypothetical protein BDZ94DRAFT_1157658, partial [Collybia nuda]
INYTTYDIRRDQDSMNPRTHCDVMLYSPETDPTSHPFWYARVLGVFHANILHTGPNAYNRSVQHMEFLWVRWFGVEPHYKSGFKTARLPKVGFVPESDPTGAFGFLDPSVVLRGCHLVPAFSGGRTNELLQTRSPTAARLPGETDDWANYYVIIWVDRDMFMRYLGGGIGHQHESKRWRSTGQEVDEDSMDIDPEPEDGLPSQDNDAAQLQTLFDTTAYLQGDENAGADTDDSDSQSDSSDTSEEEFDYGSDNDDDCAYFGPEDEELIYDYDVDEL